MTANLENKPIDFDTDVMRQHRQDCIALRIPQSGDSVLDGMIRASLRADITKAAMQGMLSSPDPSVMSASAGTHALWAVAAADALLAALEAPGGAG